MKKRFGKKSSGSGDVFIETALALSMGIIFVMVLLFTYLSGISKANSVEDVDLVLTSYAKSMESVGYLSDQMQTDIRNDLSELGMTNIDFSGSTLTKSTYGSKTILHISGTLTVKGGYSFGKYGTNETVSYSRGKTVTCKAI